MSALEPYELTAASISRKIREKSLKIRDVVGFYVDRTQRYSRTLNTHTFFDIESISRQAAIVEQRLDASEQMPLAGVPVLIKDNISTALIPTTCGSKMLKDYRPVYDAHVVERLKNAGAIVFGKANCDEFAMGSTNENSAFGPVKNPWDQTRVPGGSSGGSAAAVAADLVPIALGSDTGGSVRQPAAFCGVVGLKPSYGRVSRYGLVAYGSSLDQIGPITRSVEDAAMVLDIISGHDGRDSTSAREQPTRAREGLRGSLFGVRFGLVEEFFGNGLDSATRYGLEQAVERLRAEGADIQKISLPTLPYSIAAYYVIATAEASSNLARYDGVRFGHRSELPGQTLKQMYARTRSEGFGREVAQRIMLGTFTLSSGYYDAYYAKAIRAREQIAADFARAFENVDILLSPTAPSIAFSLGAKVDDPLAMYLGDICTTCANLVGLPALSLPCAFDANTGLPVGLQLMAAKYADEALLRAGFAIEQILATKDGKFHGPKL